MREDARFRKNDGFAEGIVTIEYKDPVTNKVKERIKGKNHIFKNQLFASRTANWQTEISDAVKLVLTDDSNVIDTRLPYITGNPIGWGASGEGSSGLRKGAFNAALSYLNQNSLDGVSWKFVYDFTPSQATGSVKTVGLTTQYLMNDNKRVDQSRLVLPTPPYAQDTLDSAKDLYRYRCGIATGIVTKTHGWTDIAETVADVSAVVGTYAGTGVTKWVGRSIVDGDSKMYILVHATNRAESALIKLYEFSDATFSTLLNTYDLPTSLGGAATPGRFYIYGDLLIYLSASSRSIYKVDYKTDTSVPSSVYSWSSNDDYPLAYALSKEIQGGAVYLAQLTTQNSWYNIGPYIIIPSLNGTSTTLYASLIYDVRSDKIVGDFWLHGSNATYCGFVPHPLAADGGGGLYLRATNPTYDGLMGGAIARYRVPDGAPSRPAGYGMTVTYEIVVNW